MNPHGSAWAMDVRTIEKNASDKVMALPEHSGGIRIVGGTGTFYFKRSLK